MTKPTTLPKRWTGWWVADDCKAVRIERHRKAWYVTVAPARDEAPYPSAELLGGGTKSIERLPASCLVDEHGRRYLEIEAGTPELGPSYQLYPVIEGSIGLPFGTGEYSRFRVAEDSTRVDAVILVPKTSIGLYDDYEDHLGVPWALPLEPLRYVGPA